jgi:lipopolysaccharide transport system ATP-binding protein
MADLALHAQRISKRYRVGHLARHRTLRESLVENAARPFRAAGSLFGRSPDESRTSRETFWALRDVSFDVRRGEVVGIIGRNGAGKSTLLKILSRITEPTTGRVEGWGRIGSLLEVGTGFHPELSGRENVYLNGAILGMRKREIERKFDEIVAFAGVEQFLDTPVKRYSSGMYVRLAFAVAAHLELEILLVDEVLAVGDAQFQKKCLGKMDSVAKEGRTVLFVSHNMALVQTLCTRGILIREGRLEIDDTATTTIAAYLASLESELSEDLTARTERAGTGAIRLAKVDISIGAAFPDAVLATGRPARFVFHLTDTASNLDCSFTIYDQLGHGVAHMATAARSEADQKDGAARDRFICELDELPLLPGRYRINVAISRSGELQDHLEGAAVFTVQPGAFGGRAIRGLSSGYGSALLHHRWILPHEG